MLRERLSPSIDPQRKISFNQEPELKSPYSTKINDQFIQSNKKTKRQNLPPLKEF